MAFTYGQTISEELSEYLKSHTTKEDRADVNNETGVGVSILRDVIYRTRSVTEFNEKGIIALMQKAVDNIEKKQIQSLKDKKSIKVILNTLQS